LFFQIALFLRRQALGGSLKAEGFVDGLFRLRLPSKLALIGYVFSNRTLSTLLGFRY